MTFWILRGFTLGPCKFGPLLEEILAKPLNSGIRCFKYGLDTGRRQATYKTAQFIKLRSIIRPNFSVMACRL